MGIEPTDQPLSNHCPMCFTANKTPDTMIVSARGIQKSEHFPGITDIPPNGDGYVHKTFIDCTWIGWSKIMNPASVNWLAVQSQLVIKVPGGADGFVQTVPELCERYFVNNLQNPFISAFYGGLAVVITQDEIVYAVSSVVPYFEDGARFDVVPAADRKITIRYANRKHRQNILLKFDIDEIT